MHHTKFDYDKTIFEFISCCENENENEGGERDVIYSFKCLKKPGTFHSKIIFYSNDEICDTREYHKNHCWII